MPKAKKDDKPKDKKAKAEKEVEKVKVEEEESPSPKKKGEKKDSKTKKKESKKETKEKSEDKKEEEEKKDLKEPSKNHIIIKKVKEGSKEEKASNWFVIHTYSGHEHRVANTLVQRLKTMKLTGKVLELLIPTQDKILIKRGKKSTVKEKLFPGYMLVRMVLDDDSWLAVRTTPGVTSFVGIGNKPTPLPPAEVESIKKFTEMEAPKYKASFTVGEAVRIIEGPFADFLGSIDSMDEAKGKVKVLVSIFGRETPVELDFLQVQKI
ncbi:transcription termination/antitermination protein NusG [Patescibacteria group bacterium]